MSEHVCNKCGGSGTLSNPDLTAPSSPCWQCGGTGYTTITSCIEKDKRIAEQAEDLDEALTLCHRFSKRIAELKKEIAELKEKNIVAGEAIDHWHDVAEGWKARAETAEGGREVSGGHWEYVQHRFNDIANDIEHIIKQNDSTELGDWGYPVSRGFPPEVIVKLVEGERIIRRAYIYAHRIDWLLSGDDGELSFLRRLNEELEALLSK